MAYIILPSRWTRQPQGPVEVNLNHPSSSELVFLFNGASGVYDSVLRRTATTRAALGVTGDALGPDLSGSAYVAFANTANVAHGNSVYKPISFLWRGVVRSFSGYNSIAAVENGGAALGWDVYLDQTTGKINFFRGNAVGYRYKVSGSGPSLNVPQTLLVSAAINVEASCSMFINSTKQTVTEGGTATGNFSDSSSELRIGRRPDGGTQLDGGVHLFGIWRREISDAEYLELYANPWQLFKKADKRIYVGVTGGTTQTLTATKFTNTSTFGTQVLTKGAVTLTTTKFTNTSVFGTHSISQESGAQSLTATKFTNSSVFGTHSVSVGAVTLTPTKFTNSSVFGTHSLSQQGGPQTLTTTKFTNTSLFGTHSINAGEVTLTQSKFTNTSVFGSHVLNREIILNATKFTNSSTFGTHVLSVGEVTLTVTKFTNVSVFGTHTLLGGETTTTVTTGGGGIRLIPLNHAYTFMIKMTSVSDHTTGLPGLTLSITASKNGGAFASVTPTSVVDRGGGWYAVTIPASDLDTEGDYVFIAEGTAADDNTVSSQVVLSAEDAITAALTAGRYLTLGQFLALK